MCIWNVSGYGDPRNVCGKSRLHCVCSNGKWIFFQFCYYVQSSLFFSFIGQSSLAYKKLMFPCSENFKEVMPGLGWCSSQVETLLLSSGLRWTIDARQPSTLFRRGKNIHVARKRNNPTRLWKINGASISDIMQCIVVDSNAPCEIVYRFWWFTIAKIETRSV